MDRPLILDRTGPHLAVRPGGALVCPGARGPCSGRQASAGAVAAERLEDMLAAESDAVPAQCHGDFGPHNLLWDGDEVASVIDLDHTCWGDPALDIAPLIGFHGAAAMTALASPEEVRRAMLHRATLPLQVAAAAHLADLVPLREHALSNFARRVADRTVFDPGGLAPD